MATNAQQLVVVNTAGGIYVVATPEEAEGRFKCEPKLGHEVYAVSHEAAATSWTPGKLQELARTDNSGVEWAGSNSGFLKSTIWRTP